VIDTAHAVILVDLTPQGLDQVAIHPGEEVSLEGERKPSELKVTRFPRGENCSDRTQEKHYEKDHPHADPAIVLKSARITGFGRLFEVPERMD
jgi:hypothetical protein